MSAAAHSAAPPVVGVDGGGTGCRARVYGPDGAALAEAEGGPSNLQTGGRTAFENIVETVDRALDRAGYAPSSVTRPRVGLGLAGVSPGSRAEFDGFGPPFSEHRIISDAHSAALGAHDGADGGVAIMGTGAAACVVRNGEARVIGGWGFRVDDLGSGGDIGRRAVRAALRAHDGPQAGDGFSCRVLERFDGDVWRAADWAVSAKPWEYAAFAPLVFELNEAGDPTAAGIVELALGELRRLIELIEAHGAERICVSGSIAKRLAQLSPVEARQKISPLLGDAMRGAALAIQPEGLG